MLFALVSIIISLMATISAQAVNKDFQKLKKWTEMKALEGCYGKANMKAYVSMIRCAMSECSQKPHPELSLPIFDHPWEFHSQANLGGIENESDLINKLIKADFIKDLLSGDRTILAALLGVTDDVAQASDNKYKRDKRGAYDSPKLEMRFLDKIAKINMSMVTERNMFTCVLGKLGIIDEEHNLSPKGMRKLISMMDWSGSRVWLKEQTLKDQDVCYESAQNLPGEILNSNSLGPKITKLNWFSRCMKMRKYKACMKFDVIEKLEEAEMPIAGLVEDSGVKEKDLLPIIEELMFAD